MYILSNDSIYELGEVIIIFLSIQSKKREVVAFLEELRGCLGKENFNIDSDFTLIKKKKPDDEEHSTPYTLLDLEYDVWDVSFHYARDPMKFPYA